MQKIEDVLTGLMIVISALVVFVIVTAGAFFLLCRSEFISLALLFAVVFFPLYTLRSIYIGFNVIFHGKYKDEMTVQENRRYTD